MYTGTEITASQVEAEAIFATILGLGTIGLLIGTAVSILMIIAMWKVFEKAGKPGWASIIPFYNVYTLYEITWGNGWYFLLSLLLVIPFIGAIAVLVINIITTVKLSKSFGKSDGFAIGLIFLPAIFSPILAFDNSTYQGI